MLRFAYGHIVSIYSMCGFYCFCLSRILSLSPFDFFISIVFRCAYKILAAFVVASLLRFIFCFFFFRIELRLPLFTVVVFRFDNRIEVYEPHGFGIAQLCTGNIVWYLAFNDSDRLKNIYKFINRVCCCPWLAITLTNRPNHSIVFSVTHFHSKPRRFFVLFVFIIIFFANSLSVLFISIYLIFLFRYLFWLILLFECYVLLLLGFLAI